MDTPPITVHPPGPGGGRRVTIRGTDVGRAHRIADLVEFLRRAGLDDVEVEQTDLIQWLGGGADTWA
ncbi:hypothetical protein [Actinacidiphila alni]|uniref:Uncharacterized protein n=1 Tax=Actinacidiphila alni TaxID=380248 RepID=A0A1I2JCU4_9ACTN|nr:hypothetical protein [Actinacidiphila alni]SFF51663.1 hypothetical protein SAMN05216251_11743 [Actinacidiphila alni]